MLDLSFWLNENKNNLDFMLNKLEDSEFNADMVKISGLVKEVMEVMLVFYLLVLTFFKNE